MDCKYGFLEGISYSESYGNGDIKECTVSVENILETEYGRLIPQYNDDSERRKLKPSLSFYKNGTMKKVYLQEKTNIETEAGIISAEFIMFYDDGSVKKIFPLDGKLTGFWTEQHEYELAEKLKLKTPVGIIESKIINISFYKSGKVKGITLWPKERIVIKTPIGMTGVRTGITFYESGKIKSFEPAKMTEVDTPIGILMAYDMSPLGIHGDNNSLAFYEDGTIKSVSTSTDEILIHGKGEEHTYSPMETISMCSDDKKDFLSMKVEFEDGKIYLDNKRVKFKMNEFTFEINNYVVDKDKMCSSCC